MARLDEFLAELKRMKAFDPDRELPERLVVRFEEAEWIGPEITGNPSRIGVLAQIPARSMEFYLQEIPVGGSSDLQRHAHESVHIVLEGEGYSEIGEIRVEWGPGSFVYTPPWAWHRHYNTGRTVVRMILVENSRLLSHLGLNRRESAGLLSYKEFKEKGR
jgi:gentisate 1,2-dioxygenase